MIRKLTDEEENLQEENFNKLACDHPHLNDYFNHHNPFYLRLRDCALEQLFDILIRVRKRGQIYFAPLLNATLAI